jgi:hypothetical protein
MALQWFIFTDLPCAEQAIQQRRSAEAFISTQTKLEIVCFTMIRK